MKRKIRIIALLAALACTLSLLAGCGQSDGGGKDTLNFIALLKCETLDPTAGLTAEKTVMHAMYDTLVAYGPDGDFVPMLAERWEESEDSMSITFYLRQDVTFHNGDPLTADDVVYSYETMIQAPNNYYITDYIGGCEKVDDYAVRFDKAAPYSKLLAIMTEYIMIIPKAYHSADPDGFGQAPVGCGPYQFVSKEVDDSVKLTAYEVYYGGEPGFPNVTVKAPLEDASKVISLETGEADMVGYLSAAQTLLVEANKDLTLVQEESWSAQTLMLMGEPLASDENLRKAIFHGISRDSAIKLGSEGVGTPSENMFSERIMGEYAGCVEDFVGYDEALAKDYLAKSNYNGEDLTLSIYGNAPIAESIQADLNKIGINIKLEQLDMNSWATKLYSGEIQMTFAEMGNDILSAEDFMLLLSASDPTYGCHMASSDEFEQLMEQIPKETDAAARRELVVRAQQICYDVANIVPLFDVMLNYAYGPAVVYDYPVSASAYLFYLNKVMPAGN